MRIDILTLFPEMVDDALSHSIIGRARQAELLDIRCHNIRDYAEGRRRTTDDYPYGGGLGMVMSCEPLYRCLEAVKDGEKAHVILMSPRGRTFDQQVAKELSEKERVILVCGHYEGVDQRFIDTCVDEEMSIGDFVLTGGELAAITITDAVGRMQPGVLAETESFTDESHFSGLLEYPQYTRPEVWQGLEVPAVLLGGNHKDITSWRRGQALRITRERRPDMFCRLKLSYEDRLALGEASEAKGGTRRMETANLILRRIMPEDDADIFGSPDAFAPPFRPEPLFRDLSSFSGFYKGGGYLWGITGPDGDKLIGAVRVDVLRPGIGSLYVFISPVHRRKGYASEAVDAVIDRMLKKERFSRIEAVIPTGSEGLDGLMERSGFTYEAELKNYFGRNKNGTVYSVVR